MRVSAASLMLLLFSALVAGASVALADFNPSSALFERRIQVPVTEPYGGCDEAVLYPDTPGWTWCRDHGYLD